MTSESTIDWQAVATTLESAGLHEHAHHVLELRQRFRDVPLDICVVGETKAGKSTLLERLIGPVAQNSLPKDVVEATARSVTIRPSYARMMAAVGAGADQEIESEERWDALVRGAEPIPERAHLELGLQSDLLRAWNVHLEDTPGLNSSTPGLRDRTWTSCRKASVVLFAMPAFAIGRRTDLDFLDSLRMMVGNIYVVLTQIDKAGIHSQEDPRLADLVRAAESALGKRGLATLGTLATSCKRDNDDEAGITALRRTLTKATSDFRLDLVDRAMAVEVRQRLNATLRDLTLRRSLLEDENRDAVREAIKALEESEQGLAAKKREVSAAIGRVENRAEVLRLEALAAASEAGSDVTRLVLRDLDSITNASEMESYLSAGLRVRLDAFRERCIAASQHGLEQLAADGEQTSADLLQELFGQNGFDKMWNPAFTSADDTNSQDAIPSDDADPEMAALEQQREHLLQEIERLRGTGVDAETVASLREELKLAQDARADVVYEPVVKEVTLSQGKADFAEAGRVAGILGDIALTVAPIPVKGKFGAMLAKVPGGAKVVKGIEKYNSLIFRRDRALRSLVSTTKKVPKYVSLDLPDVPKGPVSNKTARAWLGKILDNLSLETWGERLGGALGEMVSPDKSVTIEDPEAKRDFERAVKPLNDEIHALRVKFGAAQMESMRRDAELAVDQQRLARVDRLITSAQADAKARTQEESDHKRALQLLMRKRDLVQGATGQLQSRQKGTLLSAARASIDSAFDHAKHELVASVGDRLDKDLERLRRQVEQAERTRRADENGAAEAMAAIDKQEVALKHALEKLESDE